jgi:membrane fusion protein, multidrug efflux system
MMKKKLLPILIVALCGAGFTGWRWNTDWQFHQSTDDAYVEGEITGLSAKISGHVVEILVADNQRVQAGDVLLRIDPRDFQARRQEAQALVAARLGTLQQLDDRIAVQQALMQQARAGISAAEADLKRSQADLKRSQALVRDDYVSRQILDSRTADASKAQANVSGSNAQVVGTQRQMAVLEGDRSVATAQLEQARAALTVVENDLAATEIRAPAAGVVGNRAAKVGMYVRPGQHLLSIVPLPNLWVDANFKETQLTNMKIGQPVEIDADTFPGQPLHGRIVSFAPATGAKFSLLPPENATGNFTKVVQRVPVRISLPGDHPLMEHLRPGLSVTVRVDTRP